MHAFDVVVTDDAARVSAEAGSFLRSEPVQHNLILSLLRERTARPEPGLYGVVRGDGDVVGASFRSPLHFHSAITSMPLDAVDPLVDALASADPGLSGVAGDAGTTARFAGRWAELLKVPVTPAEGQRQYELRALTWPTGVSGALRKATVNDLDLVVRWGAGFGHDTGSAVPSDDVLARRLDEGLICLWDDGGPVGMASYTPPICGVSRIGFVYTPPEHRGHGYAAACTAAVSQAAFDVGAERCCLYTQLANPTSNAIYRRLGYEPVGEQTRYEFSPRGSAASSAAPGR